MGAYPPPFPSLLTDLCSSHANQQRMINCWHIIVHLGSKCFKVITAAKDTNYETELYTFTEYRSHHTTALMCISRQIPIKACHMCVQYRWYTATSDCWRVHVIIVSDSYITLALDNIHYVSITYTTLYIDAQMYFVTPDNWRVETATVEIGTYFKYYFW